MKFRTPSPFCKLLFVMYTPHGLPLENMMKVKYENYLKPNNSEFISDITQEELIESIMEGSRYLGSK
jgi:hypothetical protein